MKNALELQNVSKSFKGFETKDMTFSLPEGCILGLVGKNGAGKSTTIRLIMDMIHKDSGTIYVLGKNIEEDFTETKQDIGVVLDEPSFPEYVTADQMNNIMKNIYRNWDEKRYYELIDQFELPKWKKQFKNYSKGMKMKYALTLALSHNAELLIMDEPTSGLDPLSRSQLLNVLNDYMENGGKGVLFSTHITSDLDKIADMLIMIHNGRIVFQEEKDFLLDNYRIIKGDKKLLTENIRQLFLNITETAFGFTGVTRHAARVQSYLPDAITERPTIEDIMLANLGGCGK